MKNIHPTCNVHPRTGCCASPWFDVRRSTFGVFVLVALQLCASALSSARAGSIPEPATAFYGKVIELHSGYQVTEGDLTWVVHRADGVNQILHSKLQKFNGGEFSYWLDVPHQAMALGLTNSTTSVPMRGADDSHQHLIIGVGGQTATILGPGSGTFDAAQPRRTATYRVDLAVALNSTDSDGNGLPDWWKLKFGVTDAFGNPDGDGWNNQAEFLHGTDPNRDDRSPSLATKDIRGYSQGTTVVRLEAIDSDSAASNLVYTLRTTPDAGGLYLRKAEGGEDVLLETGGAFSQADVDHGRVLFVHQGGEAEDTATGFEVALRDENPAHAATTNSVAVNIYRPGRDVSPSAIPPVAAGTAMRIPDVAGFAAEEQEFVAAYVLSKEMGFVVADAASEVLSAEVLLQGSDRPHVLLGGLGDDRLAGGEAGDVLVGERGNDALRGNGGSDLFLITGRDDGNDTIEDFNAAEGDAIDISRVLSGPSLLLTDYVQITSTSSNAAIRINADGTGAPYHGMVITLTGAHYTPADLYALVDEGNLITGDKLLPPRVSITATVPTASENGPTAGELTVTRAGSLQEGLTVNLHVSGSALNGVDFHYVPPTVTFVPGQRTAVVSILPYADAITELTEAVEIAVASGTSYAVGSPSVAEVAILDLLPEVSIAAYQPLAIKGEQSPGLFLLNRGGVLNRSVLVLLQVSGSASNGVDYARINTFVNLPADQTAALIEIMPTATAVLQAGKTVKIQITPDAAYRVGTPPEARVTLIEETMSLVKWRSRYFPDATGPIESFALTDPGALGVPNLLRYAYGLNPTAPERARLPQGVIRAGHLSLDLWRRADATDLEYVVEASPDLTTWSSSAADLEQTPTPETGATVSGPNVITYRALPATDQAQKLFLRVRVIYRPN